MNTITNNNQIDTSNMIVFAFKKAIDNQIANTEYSAEDISKFTIRISLHGNRRTKIDCLYSSLSIEVFNEWGYPVIDCKTSQDSYIAKYNNVLGQAISLAKKYNRSFAKTSYYLDKLEALWIDNNNIDLEV